MKTGNHGCALLTMKVRPAPKVLVTRLGEEMVMLDLASERYFGLDSVGTACWEALTTAQSAGGAIDTLLELYDVDEETLVRDVSGMITQLTEKELVEVSSASSA